MRALLSCQSPTGGFTVTVVLMVSVSLFRNPPSGALIGQAEGFCNHSWHSEASRRVANALRPWGRRYCQPRSRACKQYLVIRLHVRKVVHAGRRESGAGIKA